MKGKETIKDKNTIEEENSTIKVIIDTGITRTVCIWVLVTFAATMLLLIIAVQWRVVTLVPAVVWICLDVMLGYVIYTGRIKEEKPDSIEISNGKITVGYNKQKFRLCGIDIKSVKIKSDTTVEIATRGKIKGITLEMKDKGRAQEIKEDIGR